MERRIKPISQKYFVKALELVEQVLHGRHAGCGLEKPVKMIQGKSCADRADFRCVSA